MFTRTRREPFLVLSPSTTLERWESVTPA